MSNELKSLLNERMYDIIERANIATFEKLLLLSESDIKGLTQLKSEGIHFIKDVVSESILQNEFKNGLQLLEENRNRIKTGCNSVDNILNGGFKSRILTEIFGESSSGKTQICLQATAQCWNTGGVYICTEDPFPVKRFNQMLSHIDTEGVSHKKCNGDRIFVEHLTEVEELKSCLRIKLPNLLQNHPEIELLVIDSIAAPFRGQYIDYVQRAKDLREIVAYLLDLATKHNLAVICVNQATANFSEDNSDGIVPALGLAWSNLVNTRIEIKKTQETLKIDCNDLPVREFKIVFSPYLERGCSRFVVTREGLLSFYG